MAYENKQIHLHTRIVLPAHALKKTSFAADKLNKYIMTTVGKLIFNEMFPADFPYLNEITKANFIETPDRYFIEHGEDLKAYVANLKLSGEFKKKDLGLIITEVFNRYSTKKTSEILDQIKDNGFKFSTVAGMTVSLSDINVAPNKQKYVEYGKEKAAELMKLLKRGRLTPQEWERHLTQLWDQIKSDIGKELMENLPRKNPINMMATSGARGNASHFTQLAGMRGLMGKPTQSKSKKEYTSSIIEVPIYSSFREGLNVSEFFISTHGVRKGLTDTALKTAESGYLTRRLVDVAQDVIVIEEDCGTDRGYLVEDILDRKTNSVIEGIYDRLVGRFVKETVIDPASGEVILEADEFISEAIATKIVASGIKRVFIRNTFTCDSTYGVCKKCYGRNMATGKIVEIGEAVGIMAAQSIGEPGTQLTMRTFHTGGVAAAEGGDITQGLPRVEELFEARCPKHAALLARIDGEITEITELDGRNGTRIVISNDKESIEHLAATNSIVRNWLKVGTYISAGDKLTEGQVNPKELLDVAGVAEVQKYIIKEVKKVYQSQGIEISDKHIEVMIRQMMRKVVVVDGGDTGMSAGIQLSLPMITNINRKILLAGKTPALFKPTLLGISKASVETDSFLSAASFQETTKVLTDAAIKGKVDTLMGLKENVIIGKLIPAGTGSKAYRETSEQIKDLANTFRAEREERNAILQEEHSLPEEMTRGMDDLREEAE